MYAALAPWGGRGDVYEVEAHGILEPETPGFATGSYSAPGATVIAVVRRSIGLEEAIARMRAVLAEGRT